MIPEKLNASNGDKLKTTEQSLNFSHRLDDLAYRVGGKRELSKRSGISEAQLYRYRNGESQPTQGSVLKLAESTGVSVQWLLTGETAPEAPATLAYERTQQQLLSSVLEHSSQALLAYEEYQPLRPLQHKIVPLLWQAVRQEQTHVILPWLEQSPTMTSGKMLQMLDFLLAFSSPAVFDVLSEVFCAIRYPQGEYPDLSTAVNQLCRAGIKYYDSRSGQHYFERVGQQLWPESANRLTKLVEYCTTQLGSPAAIRWLDVGCGNGRELSYLSRHFPHLELAGVEPSQEGLKRAAGLVKAQKLPPNCVVEGDARQLPYPSQHFDVVYSKGLLMHLPLLPNCPTGAPEFLTDVSRVLKPNGLFHIIFPTGEQSSFLPYVKLYDPQEIVTWLVQTYNFELLEQQQFSPQQKERVGDQMDKQQQAQTALTLRKKA